MLAPLKYIQVWRFSLYYVVVFGAYVALSAWLPNYYRNTFGVDLRTAALLTVAGALLTRFGWWTAGTASADNPRIPLQLERVESSRVEAADDRRFDVDARAAVHGIGE